MYNAGYFLILLSTMHDSQSEYRVVISICTGYRGLLLHKPNLHIRMSLLSSNSKVQLTHLDRLHRLHHHTNNSP